jgi:hypothetical protein
MNSARGRRAAYQSTGGLRRQQSGSAIPGGRAALDSYLLGKQAFKFAGLDLVAFAYAHFQLGTV